MGDCTKNVINICKNYGSDEPEAPYSRIEDACLVSYYSNASIPSSVPPVDSSFHVLCIESDKEHACVPAETTSAFVAGNV